ncbi:SGNH/GDSL hydrolase family protein [Methylobrevis pamukkalensis]|uniref:Multifunctional acyl-CoA thioesterase I and protease I and lysophospholipase L1 n=1 Tax=Methylobrevis pamukkalensis TaxID=1439726 RepID=A0A1E3H6Y3_9HYPH|nr:SGNH/GDSL hydrolase family protein [Methylobrevis pamukkalensis]ODN72080.1 multifunctional acyl-CoA thioesterase I and protease I and lysophospholipase L1 [Methylobrevis pamukkalensis]
MTTRIVSRSVLRLAAAACLMLPAVLDAAAQTLPPAASRGATPAELASVEPAAPQSLFSGVATAALPEACPVPDPLLALDGRLDGAIRRVVDDGRLKVLAIGSSSTRGLGASSPATTYPARLEVELERRLPDIAVEVINRGINGEKVAGAIKRLVAEVEADRPDLVIWQLGTNDRIKGVTLDKMGEVVMAGIDWLKARGIDAILMDPQFYPKVVGDTGYAEFVAGIDRMAATSAVPVVRRFDAMRHWASLPEAVRRPVLARDNFHMNDQAIPASRR